MKIFLFFDISIFLVAKKKKKEIPVPDFHDQSVRYKVDGSNIIEDRKTESSFCKQAMTAIVFSLGNGQ